ncbi:dTDP-4-dehydrorhamnose reductase [Maioricimonas rarisocia]|uniref:dTDP-4-dehydrorhamnose reductase n=1 Tax=Maioricimonas rarisocia TaxID=2528026 RepID=A0A517ZD59_9PLAN|nr:dTDP-4-dehydrorhamnose reductase [Maioricimonas rarisocia]QDU40426.1 dTDP-4-dehydrorhamnose reductase [Maioricimonas rarisocia]
MRAAIIGARGQLGAELTTLLGDDAVPLTHDELEVTDQPAVERTLREVAADIVINAAAWNAVDLAEEKPQDAFAVNALGPRNLAMFCNLADVPLVHISTDYVFGGDRGHTAPWTEEDVPGPVSAYAVSKLAGEYFVRSCEQHYVIRTCGLYGRTPKPGYGNFVQTMLRLGHERDELSVVDDQQCTPTSVRDLASAILALLKSDSYGLYHVTNSGSTTWYGFASEIFRQSGIEVQLRPITTAQYGAPAVRPPYSVLDCSKFENATGQQLRPWQEALSEYLAETPLAHGGS